MGRVVNVLVGHGTVRATMDAKEDATFEEWFYAQPDTDDAFGLTVRECCKRAWDACLTAHEPERRAAAVLRGLCQDVSYENEANWPDDTILRIAKTDMRGWINIAAVRHGLDLEALAKE